MNELAQALNQAMKEDNEHVYNMLSQLGKEMFYPKGILSQSAEAGKKLIVLMQQSELQLKIISQCTFNTCRTFLAIK